MKAYIKVLKNLFVLAFVWFSVWSVFQYILKSIDINYVNNFVFTSIYFGLATIFLYKFFKSKIEKKVNHFSTKDTLIIVFLYIISATAFYFLRANVDVSLLENARASMDSIFWLDDRILISKTFEIMFQQVFFIISIDFLFRSPLSNKIEYFLFGIYSLLIHIPIFIFLPYTYSLLLVVASFFSGVIFSYLITKYKKGFLYSYIIHLLFYIFLISGYWLLFS